MPVLLYRIDERLLHGQVLVGWGARLKLRHYLVVDDDLARSGWEQELYAAGVPEGAEAGFTSTGAAPGRVKALAARPEAGAVLTRGTAAMRALAEEGLLEGARVNVGGLHEAAGRRRALEYVYLGPEEMEDLEAIAARSLSVSARDLPESRTVPLERLLHAARHA